MSLTVRSFSVGKDVALLMAGTTCPVMLDLVPFCIFGFKLVYLGIRYCKEIRYPSPLQKAYKHVEANWFDIYEFYRCSPSVEVCTAA